jgi:hypothetical protein
MTLPPRFPAGSCDFLMASFTSDRSKCGPSGAVMMPCCSRSITCNNRVKDNQVRTVRCEDSDKEIRNMLVGGFPSLPPGRSAAPCDPLRKQIDNQNNSFRQLGCGDSDQVCVTWFLIDVFFPDSSKWGPLPSRCSAETERSPAPRRP